jgi:hypothetical protein
MYLFFKNISKIQVWVFLQIKLNSDQHLNPNNFFFLKNRRGILDILQDLTATPNGLPFIKTFENLDTLV